MDLLDRLMAIQSRRLEKMEWIGHEDARLILEIKYQFQWDKANADARLYPEHKVV